MVTRRIHSALRNGAPLLAVALLGGCGIPNLGRRPQPLTAASVPAQQSLPASPGTAWPGDGWWRGYGDPQLDRLIAEALANSPDVAAAAARLRRARATAEEVGAARLPSIDAQGQATLDKQSYNNGFPKEFLPKGWQDRGQIAASLAYDLDLWGKNRAALAAATSEARAAAIEAEQARLVLSVAIASAYADLARVFADRDVRQATLDNRLANRRLVGIRVTNGLDNRGSERAAEAEVAAARSDLAAADEAIGLRRHQLAALAGAGPDRGIGIARPALPVPGPRPLPTDVTTDLIGRRPDIAAARERVEAAASRIKVARADFFPAIRLNALIGFQALGLGNLLSADSTYGSIGPAISLPIFHGGAVQGRYRSARAGYDEAVATYNKAVLDAYQQAADAVTSDRSIAQRIANVRTGLAAAEEAYALAHRRYQAGLSTFLDVLAVENRVLGARLALAELEAAARSNDIALIRALGGGFVAPAISASRDNPHG
ncbi:MAG: efflux transporter outer membrane subunit [Novosphingobium sp.]|nr:efflux transporter outer membrane subunit [Novosphingobium sp.]